MLTHHSIYDEHDPDELPPELQPLPRVSWGDLDSSAVHATLDRLPSASLTHVPGDNRMTRGVLAVGIAIRFAGELVPTIAGLIAFGSHPEWVLSGMGLQVAATGSFDADSAGSISTLHDHLVRHPVAGRLLGAAPARALLAHALAWRSWDGEQADTPVRLELSPTQLTLRLPGRVGPTVTNPVLAELLWRSCWAGDRHASHAALDQAMHPVAPGGPQVIVDGAFTTVGFPLLPDSTRLVDRATQSRRYLAVGPQRGSEPEPMAPPVEDHRTTLVPTPEPVPKAHRPRGDRQDELVRQLTESGPTSRRDLQARLGWSRSTLRDVLRTAIDAGVVQALAPHPRSPFQIYQVRTDAKPTHAHPDWR